MTLLEQVFERVFEIIKAPINKPEMLWIIVPVAISMFLMTYYFGKYKQEELGWNTAFGNSIVMLFACLDLLRYLYNSQTLALNVQTILVVAVLLEGIILMLLNFLHALPKSFAFGISSGMTVNIIVLSLIILIYSQLPLDQITAIAVIVISAVIIALLKIIQLLQWGADEDEE
ncbi:MAG: hypothetical protein KKA65_00045 [Nanoarchaeota archaeon]|nr:hypothetical protein [Nanoarchaeota archaeon]MBU4242535.1 hypothetical protein [Nanoarchaeota archaeon]MBU4351554.1 hypothetical protein [Nanoarchaeota archaeon]MBU4455876.1 hypothetical protein [Nanoarchaeota archaeon]MCG2719742.1 hypothetical protein [Nanoarchaeota archaeon]